MSKQLLEKLEGDDRHNGVKHPEFKKQKPVVLDKKAQQQALEERFGSQGIRQ